MFFGVFHAASSHPAADLELPVFWKCAPSSDRRGPARRPPAETPAWIPELRVALVLSAADLQLSLWLRVIFSWRLLPLPALLLASCRTEMKSEQSGA